MAYLFLFESKLDFQETLVVFLREVKYDVYGQLIIRSGW